MGKDVKICLFMLAILLPVSFAQLKTPKTFEFKCQPNGCCDQHEWCRFWASIGECKTNSDWMITNCQLACSTCTLPPAPAPSPSHTETQPSRNATSEGGASSSSSNVAAAGSCSQIAENPENAAEQMASSNLINPVEEIGSRTLLSIDDVTKAVSSGCVPQLASGDCSQALCYHLSYRSLDGVCNNLKKPLLGAAFRTYIRLLPPEYDNGFSEPAASIKNNRPSVREASRVLLSSAQVVTHESFNSLLMQWGQFMSHDMAKTTLQPTANCASCDPVPSKCVPVAISDKDTNEAFKLKKCLKISRSAPVCGTGTASAPRQQLNENTAFVDGSQIYGSSSKDLHKFREGRTGFLKMSRFNNQMVLPFDQSKCTSESSCSASFTAGDIRANLFLGLSSMHILFAREHNRVASALQRINPAWSGDRLFQEARKVVGAEIQSVLYKEFLPKVLGSSFDKLLGPYKGYDPQVDPTISNVFTTSAYRFGHGMLLETYPRLMEGGSPISQGPFQFGDAVFKSNKILWEGGIDPILRGFWNTAVKRPHRMTTAITEKMFGSTDLGSLNIMRGREHGIPAYNKWRKFCGLASASTFEDLKTQILDNTVRSTLAENYPTPDDVDLYVGAMVEDPVVGGLVGTTLACIIGDQFKRTRDGDRFYFENKGVFTPSQLAEVQKSSLSRVLCDNGDAITEVPGQAFLVPKAAPLVPCNQVPQMDFSKWKE
ncbi:heme peroxidase domain-containing protein [Ditylenchus destructor]|nr:heme peroxidase domain-containing protein [Ditylenchus destructor]